MKTFTEKIWGRWARDGMRRFRNCSVLLAALCVVCVYSRGETAPFDTDCVDCIAPMVSFVNPANLSVNAAHEKITATFTKKMLRKTMQRTAFIVRQGTTPVPGRVRCFDNTVVFTPRRTLEANTLYTVTIFAGVMDLEGNSMQDDFVWSFTTGAAPDTTPPAVAFVNPVNLAENVPINRSITATFNEVMDPRRIARSSFRLAKQEAGRNRVRSRRVSGTVTFSGTTAIFSPRTDLDRDSIYMATITTRATDLSDNRMASPYEWIFTTGADLDTTDPTVSLVTPENDATDVPLNKKIAATFSEAMDPLTITTATFTLFNGSTSVPGTVIYIGTTATFTPLNDLEDNTEYTSIITTGATDLACNPLAREYVWTWNTGAALDITAPTVTFTDPFDSETDVPFNKKIAATFSEAMDPLTITIDTFTLFDGITPVTGKVAYNLTSNVAIFTPDSHLDPNTEYTSTVTTGATDLAGNPLEDDYVWYWITGVVADITAPTVTFTSPSDNETDVPLNKKIAATFSEAMDPLTITIDTFTLFDGITPVTGTVVYNLISTVATFTPDSALDPVTEYTSTITTGATDLAGNPLEVDYVWSWTTGVTADITAPTVTFTTPSDNETDVPLNKKIAATFSEEMDPLTITIDTFTLFDGITPVTGTVVYNLISNVATFTPGSALDPDTEYTSTITTGATDLAGNPLEDDYVWYWITGVAADITAPTVIFTDPFDDEANVPINKKIAVTFSEEMDPLTITIDTFTLFDGITPVTGTVVYNLISNVATFTPGSALDPDTEYTSTVTTGATDLAGNPLEDDYVWSFMTGTWTFINPEPVEGFQPGDILQPYGVLAGTAITLDGPGLHVDGDVGIHPGSTCNGCDDTTVSGVIENGTANAADAKAALVDAYDDAVGRTTNVCTLIASGILTANPSAACGGDANGVFKAGLYWSSSTIELPVDGTITLDAENDPNAVFIFQAETSITSLANSHVVLANEAQASNVFWVAGSSATIGGTSADFAGTVIALQDFTVNTGTEMLGRALARNGAVTVQVDALITVPSP